MHQDQGSRGGAAPEKRKLFEEADTREPMDKEKKLMKLDKYLSKKAYQKAKESRK